MKTKEACDMIDKTLDEPCYVIDETKPGHFSGFKPNEERPVPVVNTNDPLKNRVWAKAKLNSSGDTLDVFVTTPDGSIQSFSWNYAWLISKLF
jgi:hypothetical protein